MGLSLEQKIATLMADAADDLDSAAPRALPAEAASCATTSARSGRSTSAISAIGPAAPGCCRILMTNACSYNCHYCPMRRDRSMPRTLLKPEELVRIFLGALRRGWCEGLFVTTGIPGRPVKVMDDLITVLELIRDRHRFAGYIHVKIVPGAEAAQIERITAAGQSRLGQSRGAVRRHARADRAGEEVRRRRCATLERARRQVVRERAEERDGRPRDPLHPGGTSGMTMQFVVGATPDSDRTIVGRVAGLYARRRDASRAVQRLPARSATRRWKASAPRRRCASTASTRPTT